MDEIMNEVMSEFWVWMVANSYAYLYDDNKSAPVFIIKDGKQEIYPNRQMLVGYLWQYLEETVAGKDGKVSIDDLFARYMKKLGELKKKKETPNEDEVEPARE